MLWLLVILLTGAGIYLIFGSSLEGALPQQPIKVVIAVTVAAVILWLASIYIFPSIFTGVVGFVSTILNVILPVVVALGLLYLLIATRDRWRGNSYRSYSDHKIDRDLRHELHALEPSKRKRERLLQVVREEFPDRTENFYWSKAIEKKKLEQTFDRNRH